MLWFTAVITRLKTVSDLQDLSETGSGQMAKKEKPYQL